MPANAGHVLLPIDPLDRVGGHYRENQKLKRVFKQAWRKPDQLPGRVRVIENLPFVAEGVTQSWSPVQVAVMACRKGFCDGFDVLRVHTPGHSEEKGERALEWIDFAVSALKDFLLKNPDDFPATEQGKKLSPEAEASKELLVETEFESWSKMPNRWKLHESGLFVPGS